MAANPSLGTKPAVLDVEAVRRDFPILGTSVHGRPLTYLDSAASSQRALPVIRAVEIRNGSIGGFWIANPPLKR